jgi:hypothetical protein
MQPPLPPLKPISIKDRVSVLFRVSHAAAVLASPRRRWAYEHARIHEEDIRKVLGKTAEPGKHVTGKVDHA